MNETYFTIVNPAAGGGRCGKLAARALDRLRAAGLPLEVRETRAPGEATVHANGAYADGFRKFIAVGGDGTSFEIVNGLFPDADTQGRASLGFLPLGTGNSFLRDFIKNGTDLAEFGIKAILEHRRVAATSSAWTTRRAPLLRINTLNMGFCRGRRDVDQSPPEIPGRARLPGQSARFPGAAAAALRFRCAWTASATTGAACSLPLAIASTPAVK